MAPPGPGPDSSLSTDGIAIAKMSMTLGFWRRFQRYDIYMCAKNYITGIIRWWRGYAFYNFHSRSYYAGVPEVVVDTGLAQRNATGDVRAVTSTTYVFSSANVGDPWLAVAVYVDQLDVTFLELRQQGRYVVRIDLVFWYTDGRLEEETQFYDRNTPTTGKIAVEIDLISSSIMCVHS